MSKKVNLFRRMNNRFEKIKTISKKADPFQGKTNCFKECQYVSREAETFPEMSICFEQYCQGWVLPKENRRGTDLDPAQGNVFFKSKIQKPA